jgi:DNA-binding transcriptional ArsR family regulator
MRHLAAFLYVLLAGFAVPAQRTLYMVCAMALALWFDRAGSATRVLALALLAEAGKRDKGPRRAFKTECGGKVIFMVADSPAYAGAIGFLNSGGTVTELGKAAKGVKAMGLDSIMAAVAALPEGERAKVMEALKGAKKS